MKKSFLFIALFTLTCFLTSFSQSPDKRLSFCKQYFTAESLLKLSMKYNDNEDQFNLFIIEANKAATRAQTLLDEIGTTIKTKLTTKEFDDLKASVKFINDRSVQIGPFDQTSMMKLTLYFQLSETKLNPIIPKLMK